MAGYEWNGGTMTHAGFVAVVGGSGRKWFAEVHRGGVPQMRACDISTVTKARICAERFIEKTKDQDRGRFCAAMFERNALKEALTQRAADFRAIDREDFAVVIESVIALINDRQREAQQIEDARLESAR